MASFVATMLVGMILALISSVHCNEDFVSVNNRMDYLDEDIIQLKSGLARVEEKVRYQIDSAKISVRSELKQHISEHVREAIAGILQSESIEEMVRSQILMEVRQLQKGNQQMKRQLHRVLMSLRDVQEEINLHKEALRKSENYCGEMKVCSKYIFECETVKSDFKKCKVQNEQYKQHILELKDKLETLNQTCMLQGKELKTSTTTAQSITSSPESTTTSTSVATSSASTTKPEEQRSRIIAAPIGTSTPHQFRQLNIHSNSLSTYKLRSLKYVDSVAYVSKLRKLFIGLHSPDKIVSSNLDSYDMITIRHNVRTCGMAVDEERAIVFLTTYAPRYTISRMTTQGKHFTAIIDLSKYGGAPLSIAVNSKNRTIYACNHGKVFSITYDGHGLQTIATSSSMYAVTLDSTGSILYYNDGKTLVRMSLSDGEVTNVTTLHVIPWTITYYKDTIYYGSYGSSTGTIGAVDVGYNIVSYKLQTVSMKDSSRYAVCLVP